MNPIKKEQEQDGRVLNISHRPFASQEPSSSPPSLSSQFKEALRKIFLGVEP